jgi:hypothetical protein
MRTSELIVLAYLAYLLIAAWAMRLSSRPRLVVTAVALADALWIWWLSRQAGRWTFIRDWQPIVQILIGYWLSGLFFRAPMPRIEAWLSATDRALFTRFHLNAAISHGPRIVLELLEGAYLSVYFVLPLGFAVALLIDPQLDVDRYWSVVTLAELSCYGVLPWVQTRPPRALNDQMAIAQRTLTFRRLNDMVLRRGSIQVNTFPSGHAAGALATALAVSHISSIAGLFFGLVALAIVAGSIIGRYHYAADSIAGLIVAVGAWILLS